MAAGWVSIHTASPPSASAFPHPFGPPQLPPGGVRRPRPQRHPRAGLVADPVQPAQHGTDARPFDPSRPRKAGRAAPLLIMGPSIGSLGRALTIRRCSAAARGDGPVSLVERSYVAQRRARAKVLLRPPAPSRVVLAPVHLMAIQTRTDVAAALQFAAPVFRSRHARPQHTMRREQSVTEARNGKDRDQHERLARRRRPMETRTAKKRFAAWRLVRLVFGGDDLEEWAKVPRLEGGGGATEGPAARPPQARRVGSLGPLVRPRRPASGRDRFEQPAPSTSVSSPTTISAGTHLDWKT